MPFDLIPYKKGGIPYGLDLPGKKVRSLWNSHSDCVSRRLD
jgi:hypothetical protein